METLIIFLCIIIFCLLIVLWSRIFETPKIITEQADLTKYIEKEIYNSLEEKFKLFANEYHKNEIAYTDLDTRFSKLAIEYDVLDHKYKEEMSKKKSQEVRLGQVAEQIVPFLADFPYDSKNVVGIFRPIDYLVFNENEVIFVEVKTGDAQESQKQRNIKKLIEEKKVRYEIHRLNEKGYFIKKKEM